MSNELPIITVTLNPAIDQTLRFKRFTPGSVNRVESSERYAAGKGVNVAAMLADLGMAAVTTGFLGFGNAQIFQQLFLNKKLEDKFVRVLGDTRLGIKITDESSGQTTDINFPGLQLPPTAGEDLMKRLAALVQVGQWVVLAGSVPPGLPNSIYAELCAIVHSRGGQVVLDTSGLPLKLALQAAPEVAKPNFIELAELIDSDMPETADVVNAARQALLARGVKLAVVSMGEDGAVFVTAEQAVRAIAPRVNVISTVGAGDAMVAGLVYSLSKQLPLRDAATLATALGTYAVTRVGNGLHEPDAYKAYLNDVRVEVIG
ncbi:MAG: 1-phosphofructokinase [Tepidisphaeraceae bacterium]